MTLANANRKGAGCERIGCIFVTPFVLVWVGGFPCENLCLVCYLAFRSIGVMDHIFRVGAEICVTQVISPEHRGTLSGSRRGSWNWSSALRGLKSAHDIVGAHCATLEELGFGQKGSGRRTWAIDVEASECGSERGCGALLSLKLSSQSL